MEEGTENSKKRPREEDFNVFFQKLWKSIIGYDTFCVIAKESSWWQQNFPNIPLKNDYVKCLINEVSHCQPCIEAAGQVENVTCDICLKQHVTYHCFIFSSTKGFCTVGDGECEDLAANLKEFFQCVYFDSNKMSEEEALSNMNAIYEKKFK